MELDTILNIMSKYKLNADEILLLYLTFIAQEENGELGDTSFSSTYFNR